MAPPLFGDVFRGRRVLVTGHTGFKGSWLSEWLLALGAEVHGYALQPPTVPSLFDELGLANRMHHLFGDVSDLDALRTARGAAEAEYIFHLAAQPLVRLSYVEPVLTYDTNVMGTVNVLEAMRGCPSVRVAVIVTSDKCYENHETGQAYREDDAMGGHDPYSSSKGCAELVTAAYRRSFFGPTSTVRVATVRAGNVIGGGDWSLDRIVPDCVRALKAGEPIIVRNPQAVRPWQHVLEPLSGYLHLAARMRAGGPEYDGAWNFGPGDPEVVTVAQIVERLIAAWGSGEWRQPESGAPQPHEAHLLALDTEKAHERIGWEQIYTVQQAVEATTAWYAGRHASVNVAELVRADIDAYVLSAREHGAAWAGYAWERE